MIAARDTGTSVELTLRLAADAQGRSCHSLTVRTGPPITSGYRVTFTVDKPLQRRRKLTDDCRSLTRAVAPLEGA